MRVPVLRLLAEFLRFVGAGSVGVALYYVTFYFLTEWGVWYVASAAFASAMSFSALFALQKFWTFQNRETFAIHKQARAYLLWTGTSLLLNLALLYLLVEFAGLWYFTAQVVSTATLTLASYVVSKRIFR